MAEYRLGRLLAAPTVWEDLAKTLATTNTTWSGTVTMCQRLTRLGAPASDIPCFPAPEEVAALAPERLAAATKLGYRAVYLHELATAIANGDLDVEAWRDSDLTTDELYQKLTALKGFGRYAAGNMLRLLGRHERLAIDTVVHKMFRERMNGGAVATDQEIEAHYRRFDPWAGLVVWLDAMQAHLVPYLDALGLPPR
jgi:N-glycosylase/DNA lyase